MPGGQAEGETPMRIRMRSGLAMAGAILAASGAAAQTSGDGASLRLLAPEALSAAPGQPAAPVPDTMAQLRAQIESVVGRALADGRSDAYVDALVNEAAAEGKLFVPADMMRGDGSVDTPALLSLLDTPREGATGVPRPDAAATRTAQSGIQPAPGASGARPAPQSRDQRAPDTATGARPAIQPSAGASANVGVQPAPGATAIEPDAPAIAPEDATAGGGLPLPGASAPRAPDVGTTAGAGVSQAGGAAVTGLQPAPGATAESEPTPAEPAVEAEAKAKAAEAATALALQPAPGETGAAREPAEPEADVAEPAEAEADAVADAGESGEEPRFYVVQQGDSLSGIAEQIYGNPFRFEEIFRANRDILTSPERIYVGQRLRIPR